MIGRNAEIQQKLDDLIKDYVKDLSKLDLKDINSQKKIHELKKFLNILVHENTQTPVLKTAVKKLASVFEKSPSDADYFFEKAVSVYDLLKDDGKNRDLIKQDCTGGVSNYLGKYIQHLSPSRLKQSPNRPMQRPATQQPNYTTTTTTTTTSSSYHHTQQTKPTQTSSTQKFPQTNQTIRNINEDFLNAIEKNDIESVKRFLATGKVNLNYISTQRQIPNSPYRLNLSAIDVAIAYRRPEIIELLIDSGVNIAPPNHTSVFYETLVHLFLLSYAELNSKSFTAIDNRVLNILLKYIPINYLSNNMFATTMLQQAINFKQYEAIYSLLLHKSDIFLQDNRGLTALDYAANSDDPEIIRMVLSIIPEEERPFHMSQMMLSSVEAGNDKAVLFFLNQGVPLTIQDQFGNTLLHKNAASTASTQLKILNMLLKEMKKQNIHLIDMKNSDGQTALHLFITKRQGKIHKPILNLYFKATPNVDILDNNQNRFYEYIKNDHDRMFVLSEITKHNLIPKQTSLFEDESTPAETNAENREEIERLKAFLMSDSTSFNFFQSPLDSKEENTNKDDMTNKKNNRG